MSLAIDSRYITGIYALGQWFKVKKDTIDVDAFEFTNWEQDSPHHGDRWDVQHTDYSMGSIYPVPSLADEMEDLEPRKGRYRQDSKGYWSNVTPYQGVTFIDADTGERVSFSLVEVRAFREVRPR